MASVYRWTNSGTGDLGIASNWTLVSVPPGNPDGLPSAAGDTAIVPFGTVVSPLDFTANDDTIEIGGTTSVATSIFSGDSLLTFANPTIGSATLLDMAVPGQSTAEQALLESVGTFVNQGTVEADGPAGSSMTIEVQPGTSGAAGYYFNYGTIAVDAGNALTILIDADAEFFNAGSVVVNGGSLLITAAPGAIAGGAAPVRGPISIGNGGTVEDNTAFPAVVSGTFRTYVFNDGANDLLKIDQIGSFSARIIGFETGDTIEIGSVPFTSDSYDPTTGVLSITDAGSTVASLLFASGDFTTASFAVTSVGGDTLIETTATNTVWNNSTGAWTTAANWSTGLVPGASDTARIGTGNTDTFTVTTGPGAISVGSLILDDPNATLQISDSLTVAPGTLQQIAGRIEVTTGGTEVTTGGTLVSDGFSQLTAATLLQLDPNAVLDVVGVPNVDFASNGTIGIQNGDTAGAVFEGTVVVDGAILNASSSSAGTGGDLIIGRAGDGTPATVTVEDGGVVSDTYSDLFSDPTSFGVLTLTGAGTQWTDAGDLNDTLNTRGYMIIGDNSQVSNTPVPPIAGAAVLTVESGATLTDVSRAYIGNDTDSAGDVTVTSNGVWNIGLVSGGFLDVGREGSGNLTVSAGGTVDVGTVGTFLSNGTTFTGGGIGIGNNTGGSGSVVVSGGGLITTVGGIGVGNSGTGTLDVLSDGTVSVNGFHILVGRSLGAVGMLNVSGAGALVTLGTASAGILVGVAGTGTLDVAGGGSVTLQGNGIGVGTAFGGHGTVVVSGAGSEIVVEGTKGSSDGIGVGQAGQGALTITADGLVAIDNGNGMDIGGAHGAPAADGVGTVAVQTGGTLDVTGTLFVWSGSTLSVDASSAVDVGTSGSFDAGNVLVESGNTLVGDGLVSAGVVNQGVIEASNLVAPGQPNEGPLQIAGAVSGTGAINIDQSGVVKFDGAVASTQTITFATGGSEMILNAPPGTFAAAIDNLNTGDKIEFGGGTVVTGASVTSLGTVTVTTKTGSIVSGSIVLSNVSFAAGANQSFFSPFLDASTGDWAIQVAPVFLDWTGSVNTDLGMAGNWSPLGPPNSAEDVVFDNDGGTLTGSASMVAFNFLGSGTWTLNGATLTVAGEPDPPGLPFAGQFTTDTVLNDSTLNAGGFTTIGSAGGATVTAQAGSSVTTLGDIVGLFSGQPGSLVLTGAGTNWTEQLNAVAEGNGSASGFITLGQDSGATGTLSVSGGASLTTQTGSSLGLFAGAQGSATIGAGGTWSLTGTSGLIIGRAGSGSVTVDGGGEIMLGGTFNAVGDRSGSSGELTINAGGTVLSTLPAQTNDLILTIGNQGASGTLAAATGSVLVDGAGALLNLNGNPLAVSSASNTNAGGDGSLTISGGGTVEVGTPNSSVTSALAIGKAVGSTGTVTVTGAGSSLMVGGFAHLGRGGSGQLFVEFGGTATFGLDPTGNGGLNIGVSTSSPGSPVGGTGSVEVTTGGLLTSDAAVTVGGNGASGTLTVDDNFGAPAGTFIAETSMAVGVGNTVVGGGTGALDIEGGTVDIQGNGLAAGAAALSLATFSGSTASVDVEGGSLSVTGTMVIGAAGTADVIIGDDSEVSASTATIGATGTITLAGGTLDPATLTNAGTISGFGTLDDALVNNSTVIADFPALDISGAISGAGTLTIAEFGTLDAAGSIAAGQQVAFNGTFDTTLILGTPGAGFSNPIEGLNNSDRIELAGITISGAAFTAGSIADVGSVTVTGSAAVTGLETYIFNDVTFAAGAVTSFVTGHDESTGDDFIQVACYLEGTLILTDRGEVPVEALAIGDGVITRSGKAKPIKWIGRRSYAGAFAAANPTLAPVLIRAGALADGVPRRDLYVSPEHAMFVDGVLVPARQLVNGTSILAVRDVDPIRYFHVELAAHDVIFAEGAAAETFVDCDSRGMFHNAAEFARLYPDEPSPALLRRATSPGCGRGGRWRFCARVVERGRKLVAINRRLAARAASIGFGVGNTCPLDGHIDDATQTGISGWAWCRAQPDVPVRLEILAGDSVIGTVLADRLRADLQAAGIGDGRHGFELRFTRPLDPFLRHSLTLRRAVDHAPLPVAPCVVEPAERLDEPARAAVAALLRHATARAESVAEADTLHRLLLAEARQAQLARLRLLRREGPVEQRRGAGAVPVRRALVIDEAWPRADRDAGSQAIVSHMRALRRKRWQVSFTAAAGDDPVAKATLETLGIVCHAAPEVGSVEELLRDAADQFQLVYLHRLAVAGAYAGLVRRYQPRARLIYSVADLHHLRLARQAAIEARPELARRAAGLRRQELLAVAQADAVITHSAVEAAMLARDAPGAQVAVVPCAVRPGPAPLPWAKRTGAVMVANFAHEPNADGLLWLAREVMPLVWAEAPDVMLTVAGAGLAPGIERTLRDPRMKLLGHVAELRPLLAKARLAVAPLRYGAGIKGKVLEAWAAGLPCAMTPIAAEGLPLDAALAGSVAADAAGLARVIAALHDDAARNAAVSRAGRAALRRWFSEKRVDAALAAALVRPAARVHVLRPGRAPAGAIVA